jgi:glycosyltransferase involved in cell wall biosynthesis
MSRPRVSVVVPTFERAQWLRRCLHALLRQTLPPEAYEIVVVDNGSGDDTRDTVERIAAGESAAGRSGTAGCSPSVRYVFEGTQGLSHAKNTGAEAARGEIVAYIDDDALACPEWLRLIAGAFSLSRPRPQVVGGPAFPLLVGRRPSWFQDRYETASWGEAPRLLERHEYFYGLNVAFRRDLILRAGGFDPDLGMKGTALGFAEDAEVFDRLWAASGGDLVSLYLPEAYVVHLIPETRVDPIYRMKRSFVIGLTQGLREAAEPGWSPLRAVPQAAYGLARVVLRSSLHRPYPPHPANWAAERGAWCAQKLGYLGGTLGLRTTVRRSH